MMMKETCVCGIDGLSLVWPFFFSQVHGDKSRHKEGENESVTGVCEGPTPFSFPSILGPSFFCVLNIRLVPIAK